MSRHEPAKVNGQVSHDAPIMTAKETKFTETMITLQPGKIINDQQNSAFFFFVFFFNATAFQVFGG